MSDSARLRILVADDNEVDVHLISHALEESGVAFDIAVASDGKKAMALIAATREPGAEKVAGIILDLNLGTVSGLQVVRSVLEDPLLASTPVVILTSAASPADQKQVESIGVSAFLIKPLDLDTYLQMGRQISELFVRRILTGHIIK